jgi:predicted amidohydrolase
MSIEKLQAFAEAVSKSEELQKRLASIQAEAAKSTAEKLASLSESAGTPFTAEEYLNSVAESADEMSAQQLQSVAGGVWEPSSGNILHVLSSIFSAGSIGGFGCITKMAVSTIRGDLDRKECK